MAIVLCLLYVFCSTALFIFLVIIWLPDKRGVNWIVCVFNHFKIARLFRIRNLLQNRFISIIFFFFDFLSIVFYMHVWSPVLASRITHFGYVLFFFFLLFSYNTHTHFLRGLWKQHYTQHQEPSVLYKMSEFFLTNYLYSMFNCAFRIVSGLIHEFTINKL